MTDDWEARLAAKREERAARKGEPLPTVETSTPSLTPIDMGVGQSKPLLAEFEKVKPPEVLDNDQQVDWLVDHIDILDAYRRWVGKEVKPFAAGQTENIMVSCPNPGHADNNPSAAINLDKQLYMCYACELGGDKFTMASNYFGIPMDGVKFNDLRRRMVSEVYGWSFEKNAQGFPVGVSPEERQQKQEEAEQAAKDAIQRNQEDAHVLTLVPADDDELAEYDDEPEDFEVPTFDWEPLAEEDTFIGEYMNAVRVDSSPEEFHLWNSFHAVSLAMGLEIYETDEYKMYANLFTCILGKTGIGKSKSKRALHSVLKAAMPYNPDRPTSDGVYITPSAGSGEVLVDMFKGEHVTKKGLPPLSKVDVKAFVEYDELSDIMARGGRMGSTLKPVLMQLADSSELSAASRTHGTVVIPKHFGAFSTSTQPRLLRDLLNKNDSHSGFLNRMIFVTGTSKKRRAFAGAPVELDRPKAKLKELVAWCKGRGEIQWSEDAMTAWETFHDSVQSIPDKDDSGLLARILTHMRKLIMIFSVNAMEEEISTDSVYKATHLWPYMLETYALVNTSVLSSERSDFENEVKHVVEILVKRRMTKGQPPWVSPGMVTKERKSKGWQATVVSKVMKELFEAGELEFMENFATPGRGAPIKKAYTLK